MSVLGWRLEYIKLFYHIISGVGDGVRMDGYPRYYVHFFHVTRGPPPLHVVRVVDSSQCCVHVHRSPAPTQHFLSKKILIIIIHSYG